MKVWRSVHICSAFLVAAIVPAIVVGILGGSTSILLATFLIALGHAFFLGVPIFAVLWRKKWINLYSAVLSGVAIGVIGIGILAWPLGGSGSSSVNGIQTVVNGVPTVAGWLEYLSGISIFGAFGASGGIAFFGWLKLSGALQESELGPGSPLQDMSRRNLLMPACPLIAVVGILLSDAASVDNSCHNPLRNGRTSISPKVSIDLAIPDEDWKELTNTLENFSIVEELSFRDASENHPDVVKTLYLSLCSETGLIISTSEQRWAREGYRNFMQGRGTGIQVYETGDGSNWERVTRRLVNTIDQRWPASVRFRGNDGTLIAEPESLKGN